MPSKKGSQSSTETQQLPNEVSTSSPKAEEQQHNNNEDQTGVNSLPTPENSEEDEAIIPISLSTSRSTPKFVPRPLSPKSKFFKRASRVDERSKSSSPMNAAEQEAAVERYNFEILRWAPLESDQGVEKESSSIQIPARIRTPPLQTDVPIPVPNAPKAACKRAESGRRISGCSPRQRV